MNREPQAPDYLDDVAQLCALEYDIRQVLHASGREMTALELLGRIDRATSRHDIAAGLAGLLDAGELRQRQADGQVWYRSAAAKPQPGCIAAQPRRARANRLATAIRAAWRRLQRYEITATTATEVAS